MSETRILTPLSEVEKAELLDAIPGNLPQRMMARRALAEIDHLRAERDAALRVIAKLRAKCRDEQFDAIDLRWLLQQIDRIMTEEGLKP